jgi:hypothetical protein
VDVALREALGLDVGVAERHRVVDVHAADRLDHRLELREPGDEDVVGLDPDQVADRLGQQLGAAVIEGGVDLVVADAGDVDVRVAGYADRGRRAGPGVQPDQLERVAACVRHVLAGPGVGADGHDPDDVGADVDGGGTVDLDQRQIGRLDGRGGREGRAERHDQSERGEPDPAPQVHPWGNHSGSAWSTS